MIHPVHAPLSFHPADFIEVPVRPAGKLFPYKLYFLYPVAVPYQPVNPGWIESSGYPCKWPKSMKIIWFRQNPTTASTDLPLSITSAPLSGATFCSKKNQSQYSISQNPKKNTLASFLQPLLNEHYLLSPVTSASNDPTSSHVTTIPPNCHYQLRSKWPAYIILQTRVSMQCFLITNQLSFMSLHPLLFFRAAPTKSIHKYAPNPAKLHS